ncbi:MAG: RnfABCDGE type electron transport complex subunit D [Treponema sp.]|nr:RnfABCDGE type electron transport complex subunit D [Treponema sp.]
MPDGEHFFLQRPQINISFSTSGRMWLVFFSAFMCVLQSALSDGGSSMVIALVALITSILAELLLTWRKHGFNKIRDGSAAAASMVFSILLPNQIHPLYAAVGAFFAIVVVKNSFGGLGSNWLNPALGGWIIIRLSWPHSIVDALGDPPLFLAATNPISLLDSNITTFLNETIFSLLGTELPFGYIDLLFYKGTGLIADRGLFALLVCTIVLIAFRVSRCFVPAVFLAVYGFLVKFLGDISHGGQYWAGDLFFGIFSGGTIAAAFILAAEPASGAKSRGGVFTAVVLGSVLSWLFRYRGFEYCGSFIALALVNCLTTLIRLSESRLIYSRKSGLGKGPA